MVDIHLDKVDAEDLDYLAEGAGNIVYRFTGPKAATAAQAIGAPRIVVRFRKDLQHLPPVAEQYACYASKISTPFPAEHLVHSGITGLDIDLVDHLNAALAARERAAQRAPNRHGQYLARTESHALLMEDMSARPGETLLELKPKWLAQSPTAPPAARRCRTCALRAMRASTAADADPARAARGLCPLDLVGTPNDIDSAVRVLLAAGRLSTTRPSEHETLKAYLRTNTILPRLQTLQARLDPAGILCANDPPSDDFLMATTLRDCTLFIAIAPAGCTARLADLDWKMPEPDKVGHWRGVETALRDLDWYAGRREWATGCQLERGAETGLGR